MWSVWTVRSHLDTYTTAVECSAVSDVCSIILLSSPRQPDLLTATVCCNVVISQIAMVSTFSPWPPRWLHQSARGHQATASMAGRSISRAASVAATLRPLRTRGSRSTLGVCTLSETWLFGIVPTAAPTVSVRTSPLTPLPPPPQCPLLSRGNGTPYSPGMVCVAAGYSIALFTSSGGVGMQSSPQLFAETQVCISFASVVYAPITRRCSALAHSHNCGATGSPVWILVANVQLYVQRWWMPDIKRYCNVL
jgi:hypothetical protein